MENYKKIQKTLEEQNIKISNIHDLIGDKNPSVFFPFLLKKFGYLLDPKNEPFLSEKEIRFRKKFNKIIKLVGPLALKNKQAFENRNNLKDINDTTPDSPIIVPEEPVIWLPNHGFKDDPMASLLAVKRNAYVIFGSLPEFFNTFNSFALWLNGFRIINRKVSESRNSLIPGSINILNHGVDLLFYPEGTLNKSMEKIILPLWPGIYKIAKETGAPIIPIIHYLKDRGPKTIKNKLFPTENDIIHTVIDDPVKIDDMSEKAALDYLRDILATWEYLLMERYGKTTREEILSGESNINEAWENVLENLVKTMDYYDSEIEAKSDYQPKDIIMPEDAWKDIANIKTINSSNVNDVVFAKNLVLSRKKENFQRRF